MTVIRSTKKQLGECGSGRHRRIVRILSRHIHRKGSLGTDKGSETQICTNGQ